MRDRFALGATRGLGRAVAPAGVTARAPPTAASIVAGAPAQAAQQTGQAQVNILTEIREQLQQMNRRQSQGQFQGANFGI